MSELDDRVANLERRLAALEGLVRGATPAPPPAPAASSAALPYARPAAPAPPPAAPPSPPRTAPPTGQTAAPSLHHEQREPRARPRHEPTSLVTNVLGWGGAAALVLAASYLIKLVYDSGWLTPERQVAFAAMFGVGLVVAGFPVRRHNPRYAGYLPAAGIGTLFLTVYGAHLYHHLIAAPQAMAAVIGVCLVSLWLCLEFEGDLYALFAVAGSYSAPILVQTGGASVTGLVIYFTAWSLVFCVFSIWQGRRMIYLLALYLALLVFDAAWLGMSRADWVEALVFQCAQFAIFGVATARYSIHWDEPLTQRVALAHLPPMLLFYFLQYALLRQHLPEWAPWIASASAAVVLLLYLAARNRLTRAMPGGEFLLWSYVALVAFHAGYVHSVPEHWAPWVAAGVIVAGGLALLLLGSADAVARQWPLWAAAGIVVAVNYLRVLFDQDLTPVPGQRFLPVVYAAELYAAYHFAREKTRGPIAIGLLYGGHVAAMAAAVRLIDEPIVQSAAWGAVAIVCLMIALRNRERLLGQSSLIFFAAAALKVLLYDLSDAQPIWRIVSLVALGLLFYGGGILYQRVIAAGEPS